MLQDREEDEQFEREMAEAQRAGERSSMPLIINLMATLMS
jgi:hypothetical protein